MFRSLVIWNNYFAALDSLVLIETPHLKTIQAYHVILPHSFMYRRL
jgi:hypothetical protein